MDAARIGASLVLVILALVFSARGCPRSADAYRPPMPRGQSVYASATGAPFDPDADSGIFAPPDSGVHPDAAPPDSGEHPDAEVPDSGIPPDSGEHPDAEPPPDSGTTAPPAPSFTIAAVYGGNGMTGLRIEPTTGRLYVTEKRGVVLVFEPSGGAYASPTVFADFTSLVDTTQESGLLGIELDPEFSSNGELYVFLTTTTDQRLLRLTAAPDGLSLATTEVVLDGLPRATAYHKGGGIGIRASEPASIYISLGDDGAPSLVQNTAFYEGKILRVAKATGLGLADNPFWTGDATDTASRVWAVGHRNPFRFAFATDLPGLIVSENGDDIDRLYYATAGANGLWSTSGDSLYITAPGVLATRTSDPRSALGVLVLPVGAWSPPSAPSARSVLWGEWVGGPGAIVDRYTLGDGPSVTYVDRPLTGFSSVDLQLHPGGCVYGLASGTGESLGTWYEIQRACPSAGAPAPSFASSTSDGPAPLAVTFTDSSTDDGTISSWSWAFGDGASSTAQNPTHTYVTPGRYTVSLTVTDDDGLTNTRTAQITVRSASGGALCVDLSAVAVTTGVDYDTQVEPLWTNCTGCHSGTGSSNAGLSLVSPSAGALVGQESTVPGVLLVTPGDPASSYLLEVLACDIPRAGRRMGNFTTSQLGLVRDWIAELPPPDGGADAGVEDSGTEDGGAEDGGADAGVDGGADAGADAGSAPLIDLDLAVAPCTTYGPINSEGGTVCGTPGVEGVVGDHAVLGAFLTANNDPTFAQIVSAWGPGVDIWVFFTVALDWPGGGTLGFWFGDFQSANSEDDPNRHPTIFTSPGGDIRATCSAQTFADFPFGAIPVDGSWQTVTARITTDGLIHVWVRPMAADGMPIGALGTPSDEQSGCASHWESLATPLTGWAFRNYIYGGAVDTRVSRVVIANDPALLPGGGP